MHTTPWQRRLFIGIFAAGLVVATTPPSDAAGTLASFGRCL